MLRRLAASQAAAGERVIVGALTGEQFVARELRDQGVAVSLADSRWLLDPIAAARLLRLQGSTQADVIHAWDSTALMHSSLRRRSTGPRLIVSLDAVRTERPWAARIVRSLRNRVDAFVAADEPRRIWLVKRGVADQRINLIRAGVARAAPTSGQRSAWLAPFTLPADAKVIAVAGPLIRPKGVDEAIWCFELVRVLYPEARLLIFGDGPDRCRLERFADDVSDPGCVQFLGFRDDVADLLPHADVFWQLDASASTPLAMLEAQAAGVPVVASDVAAHRAAIQPDRTGLLVPLGNRAETARATDYLLADAERAKRMGAVGATYAAERWSLDAAIASYERLYEKLLTRAE
jgi:glycosyltransferase involved in cell wall biosynthesis